MDDNSQRGGRPRVLIAGGGVAALEAALALRELAGERLEVQLWAPGADFVYRPFSVGEPYGAAEVLRFDLGSLAERIGVSFHLGSVLSVDTGARLATVRDGEQIPYDYLLMATGARMLWAVPGAVTFWGAADEGGIGGLMHRLRAGIVRSVAFTMPTGHSWGLPLYELALLAAAMLARSGIEDATLTVVTPEDAPLELFGRAVGERVRQLLEERGIELVVGARPVEFVDGRLAVAPGDPVDADAAVSLPRLEGRRIDEVPSDANGFVRVDEHGAVLGQARVFAAGDVTAFPMKQRGIATQQAVVAAKAIAAVAGCEIEPAPFDPVLRGVLWTGSEQLCLHGKLNGGNGRISKLSAAHAAPRGGGRVIMPG